jgi:hypothetical protein
MRILVRLDIYEAVHDVGADLHIRWTLPQVAAAL